MSFCTSKSTYSTIKTQKLTGSVKGRVRGLGLAVVRLIVFTLNWVTGLGIRGLLRVASATLRIASLSSLGIAGLGIVGGASSLGSRVLIGGGVGRSGGRVASGSLRRRILVVGAGIGRLCWSGRRGERRIGGRLRLRSAQIGIRRRGLKKQSIND